MIVDHLRGYVDEAAAIADLPQHYGEAGWGPNVAPGVRVVLAEAVRDEVGEIVTPEVLAEGFFILISRRALDPALISGEAARLATDRDAAMRGEPFGLFCWDIEAAGAVLRIEPVPSGSDYPFGNLVLIA